MSDDVSKKQEIHKTLFVSIPQWSDVEILYKPPSVQESPLADSIDVGSSNHVGVFNRRLLAILNRVEWLKVLILDTVLGNLLELDRSVNTSIGFDVDGVLCTKSDVCGYEVGDIKQTVKLIHLNRYTDNQGYIWHIATPENPINNSFPFYKNLYMILWEDYTGKDKGDNANDDWNMGYCLYIDLDGSLIFTGAKESLVYAL